MNLIILTHIRASGPEVLLGATISVNGPKPKNWGAWNIKLRKK
jgi:hypothetical protein